VIHHGVDLDQTEEFNRWQGEVLEAIKQFPGFMGA